MKTQRSPIAHRFHVVPVVLAWFPLILPGAAPARGEPPQSIDSSSIHVRGSGDREWAWFDETPEQSLYRREFEAAPNDSIQTLTLDQFNVKQTWSVRLNDVQLGNLIRDENAMRVDFAVPAGTLNDGVNVLQIEQRGDQGDDIRIANVQLHSRAPEPLRNSARVRVTLTDAAGNPIPGRITVTDSDGILVPVGAVSGDGLAVRQGVIYTATGAAEFGLSAGSYQLAAGHGFEYSIERNQISIDEGQTADLTIKLKRQVDTDGWVACDTHVHTVTHSGHGDCTIDERMVTLAGEGVEWPIATDHNKAIDYRPTSHQSNTETFFTPVIGDELTTRKGHFNLFPLDPDQTLPDHRLEDWGNLFDDIDAKASSRVAILNHGRDIHSGFRPFAPAHHVSLTGERLDGRPVRFNAMEICNSGAVLTDPLILFRDWCGLINRGYRITPVGCSDSHDVARYIVGQGRTYVRGDDASAGNLSTDELLDAFTAGRVIVSYGLFANVTVERTGETAEAEIGDLVTPAADASEVTVTVDVSGPAWAHAENVSLWINGSKRFEKELPPPNSSGHGFTHSVQWKIPLNHQDHDFWITAVAMGPGVDDPAWQTALPYQPTSTEFTSYTLSSTGAIWIDANRSGGYESPLTIAKKLVERSANAEADLAKELSTCDDAIIHQVASLLREHETRLGRLEDSADRRVSRAISQFRKTYRESLVDQLENRP